MISRRSSAASSSSSKASQSTSTNLIASIMVLTGLWGSCSNCGWLSPSLAARTILKNDSFRRPSSSMTSSSSRRISFFVQAFAPLQQQRQRRPAFTGIREPLTISSSRRPSTVAFATTSTSTSPSSSSSLGTPPTSFDDGVRPYQITTPIYYVNDKPHIGHAYTSIACDVLARYMRLSGRDVFFLTGTDEHGQKVEQSAQQRGLDNPQQFVDEMSVPFRNLLELLNISHDAFVRTTSAQHQECVQALWNRLVEKGHIYKGTYEGWYSVRDECFYNDSELVDGKAPTGAAVEWVAKEESYFFRLSAFEERLLQHYEEHADFIAPDSRRNEVLSFVQSGLRDLSVSRTSFSWGVPVPNDAAHVMYVWMDALTNYISALGYQGTDFANVDDNMAKYWPASLHVVGKDILRFHAVYWPAILMAAELPVPKRLFAHGWWTKDGQKISKSVGNVIDPVELVDSYGVDQTRFFLMAEVSFGNDGDFSHRDMVLKVNNNLANELGNLCQRTMSMVFKNCDKAIPYPDSLTEEDEVLLSSAHALRAETSAAISQQALLKYVQALVDVIRNANKYIDNQAPWTLRKTDPKRADTVLYVILEVLRHAAILYQPLIPTSANRMLDQLTVPADERTFACLGAGEQYKVKPGTPIAKPKAIFPRLEVP